MTSLMEMFPSCRSMSTNTGVAPTESTAFAVATCVSDGTITSSPLPMPKVK